MEDITDTSGLEALRTGYGPLNLLPEQPTSQEEQNTVKVQGPGGNLELAIQDGQVNIVPGVGVREVDNRSGMGPVCHVEDELPKTYGDNITLQEALKVTHLGEPNVVTPSDVEPVPALMPEISGDIPVYSDGRINFRKHPTNQMWQIDWNHQGQRVWAPVAALGNGVWQLLRTHTRERQHFPRELDQLVWTLLNMPDPRQLLTTSTTSVSLPPGFEGTITSSSLVRGSLERPRVQPKRKPFVNPAKALQKADRLARKAARKASKHG